MAEFCINIKYLEQVKGASVNEYECKVQLGYGCARLLS